MVCLLVFLKRKIILLFSVFFHLHMIDDIFSLSLSLSLSPFSFIWVFIIQSAIFIIKQKKTLSLSSLPSSFLPLCVYFVLYIYYVLHTLQGKLYNVPKKSSSCFLPPLFIIAYISVIYSSNFTQKKVRRCAVRKKRERVSNRNPFSCQFF